MGVLLRKGHRPPYDSFNEKSCGSTWPVHATVNRESAVPSTSGDVWVPGSDDAGREDSLPHQRSFKVLWSMRPCEPGQYEVSRSEQLRSKQVPGGIRCVQRVQADVGWCSVLLRWQTDEQEERGPTEQSTARKAILVDDSGRWTQRACAIDTYRRIKINW